MYAEKQEKYLSLLHDETSLALGCTEPGAVALAAAYAAAVLEEEVQKIKIIVSSYILKNGMNPGNRNVRFFHCSCNGEYWKKS